MSVVEKVGVAFGTVVPASVELKKYYTLYAVHKLYLLLSVLSHHIGHLVGARLVLSTSSCSPVIFRKSHQSVAVNS